MRGRRTWYLLGLLVVCFAPMQGLAASDGDWSTPFNLSDWQDSMEVYRLHVGAEGTQAAFWPLFDLSTGGATLYARVRPPGGAWSSTEAVASPVKPAAFFDTRYWGSGVGPEGTAWVVWTAVDGAQPGDNRRVMVAQRPHGGAWTAKPLSEWYESEVRSAALAIGPDGGLVAAWVACTSGLGTPSQGPCAVHVRRRPAGASDWGPTARLDGSSGMGIMRAYALVGPGGLSVVIWMEANPVASAQWGVKARAYVPSNGAWEASITDVSDGWIVPENDEGLGQPVMGPDGLAVAAWTAKINPSSALIAQYSATRSPQGTWSNPVQLSSIDTDSLGMPHLAIAGGTTIAAWDRIDAIGKEAIFANARDAGGVWGAQAQVSTGWEDNAGLNDLKMWPDGTAVVLWQAQDNGLPATADESLFWSVRRPNEPWGGGGKGQLGHGFDQVRGGALGLGQDGSGTALWGVSDAGLPTGQQASLQVASLSPGSFVWSSPQELHGGQELMAIWHSGVAVGPGDGSVAAAWLVVRTVANPGTPRVALFFSEMTAAGHRVYLPLIVR